MKREYFILTIIFLIGFLIRFLSIYPSNIIFGFDQARDLFDTKKIIAGDIRIIGPTAGNNANLHHGVAFLYFIIPPLLFNHNPLNVALWQSVFNSFTIIILFFFAKSLFRSKKAGIIAATLTSVSYYFVQFSGWISNPGITLLTVPLFFFGLWEHKMDKTWGLPLAFFSLGLSIQFELFFLYLIPIVAISWFALKLKFPNTKTVAYSILAFVISLSTMIVTELKFHFSGVKAILFSNGPKFESSFLLKEFFARFWPTFSLTLFPSKAHIGIFIGIALIGFLLYKLKAISLNKAPLLLLLIYLFSPMTMLLLGYHKAPWFLIGLPPAIILLSTFFLSKIKLLYLVPIVILIVISNITQIKSSLALGQPLLEPDPSAILSSQIAVMDYTYQKSEGERFAINSVTNPLYINATWAWNYDWYSKKYGFKPSWLGGDQIPPYNTLPKSEGKEKIFFLIIDTTPRIPEVHKILATNWAEERGNLIEEKVFGGIRASMWKTKSP